MNRQIESAGRFRWPVDSVNRYGDSFQGTRRSLDSVVVGPLFIQNAPNVALAVEDANDTHRLRLDQIENEKLLETLSLARTAGASGCGS